MSDFHPTIVMSDFHPTIVNFTSNEFWMIYSNWPLLDVSSRFWHQINQWESDSLVFFFLNCCRNKIAEQKKKKRSLNNNYKGPLPLPKQEISTNKLS
jgi:hypothetical protein